MSATKADLTRDDWRAIWEALDHAIICIGETLGDRRECSHYEPEDLENMRLRQGDWLRLLEVIGNKEVTHEAQEEPA